MTGRWLKRPQLTDEVGGVRVESTVAGEPAVRRASSGQFDLGAQQQLMLFMFLTSLAGSAALVQTRRLGIARRMFATPTSVRTILLGEGLGRFAVALWCRVSTSCWARC